MKKISSIIVAVLIILIISVCFIKINKANKIIKKYSIKYKENSQKVKEMNDKFNLRYNMLGRKIRLTKFSNINGKDIDDFSKINSKYLLLMIIPKINCGQCISRFTYYLNKLESLRIKVSVLGYKKSNMIKVKKQFSIKKPVYFIDDYKWFKRNNIEKGPIVLLLDGKTHQILNIFYSLYFIDNIEKRFMNFITRLNNEKS